VLSRTSYPQDYVDTCRAAVRAHLASYDALGLTPEAGAGFEPGYSRQLILALDNYFTHRARGQEGKDGNPLNEVRMLCTSIRDDGGVLTLDKTIRHQPAASVLGLSIGDPIDVARSDFARLADAFFDEIEKRFPENGG
jgi:hypothetical protein